MGIIGVYLFIIGCCLGSFINVIAYRLTIGQSLIYPRSRCPRCKTKIKWFDNIHFLSWFFLRGKCRACKNNISITYPLVEISLGILIFLNLYSNPTMYETLPFNVSPFLGVIFYFILITLAILDFKYFWLPKFITMGGLFLGLFVSLVIDLLFEFENFNFIIDSFTGALVGYLIFYLLSYLGLKIFKKPVMGKGDIKLTALLGSWLGIQGLFISIWLAFITAGLFVFMGVILQKIKRNQKIPFGIFLAASGIMVWQFGNQLFLEIINLGI